MCFGSWIFGFGRWDLDLAFEFRILSCGLLVFDFGFGVLDFGFGFGFWIVGFGFWILGVGFWAKVEAPGGPWRQAH